MLTPEQQLEAWRLVEDLRAPEGATVTLMCDNPDFGAGPNNKVSCCDCWTGWDNVEFVGDTVLGALRAAAEAKRARSTK